MVELELIMKVEKDVLGTVVYISDLYSMNIFLILGHINRLTEPDYSISCCAGSWRPGVGNHLESLPCKQ